MAKDPNAAPDAGANAGGNAGAAPPDDEAAKAAAEAEAKAKEEAAKPRMWRGVFTRDVRFLHNKTPQFFRAHQKFRATQAFRDMIDADALGKEVTWEEVGES